MAGDYSRKTFNREKHYSGVLMQQGRVQLDADWNEQWEIEQHFTRTEAVDVIGKSGAPKKGGGFQIGVTSGLNDLTISPGRIYVDGLLFELEKSPAATYFNQPYYPLPDGSYFNNVGSPPDSPSSSPPNAGLMDGTYLAYLDTWQREINFHDDPHIHEVALGEADTATRMQNVWQVKLLAVTPPSSGNPVCTSSFPEWANLIALPTGKMVAQTITVPGQTPCELPASSGYRRLENQLYRVEVQTGGPLASATFKWSRDNATVETMILSIDNTTITVADLGRDKELGFAPGQWVEIVNDESTLQGPPNPLVNIQTVTPGGDLQIIVDTDVSQYSGTSGLKLRRWDQVTLATAGGLPMTGGWLDVEAGIQVMFGAGTYNAGDYWLIPARTATGDIEWPPFDSPGASPLPQPPAGTRHGYCRLAVIQVQNGVITILSDCRNEFPSLTEICAEDICFNNNTCNLSGADNVQEALDLLCAANEMRDHNKYLHGYGVVCGLQTVCNFDRTYVTIKNGYAIDCNGNVIRLNNNSGLPYAVVQNAQALNLLDNTNSGDVSLYLDSAAGVPTIYVEAYVQKSFWEEILDGTLLKDFYDDSIGKLLNFITTELGPFSEVAPVPIGQKRVSALINLIFQYINSATGPYTFLSGSIGQRNAANCPNANDDDMLLWCMFNDLRAVLASDTFCGMYDNDPPFPDYNIEPGLKTIYGGPWALHERLQVTPDNLYAYTSSGVDNKIYKYDLANAELLSILTFPGDPKLVLQDIAMSFDGTELVAVGTLTGDSYFATLTIDTDTWGASSPVAATTIGRIAFAPVSNLQTESASNLQGLLFGSVVGQGIYKITGIGLNTFSCTAIGTTTYNATGAFAVRTNNNSLIFALAVAQTTTAPGFDNIALVGYGPDGFANNNTMYKFPGTDYNDDLIFYKDMLYVTGTDETTSPATRQIGYMDVFNAVSGFTNTTLPSSDPVFPPPSSVMRLAGYNDYMLIVYADSSFVPRVTVDSLVKGGPVQFDRFSIPVQIFPNALVVSADKTTGYVLNTMGNTITTIDFATVYSNSNPPLYTTYPPVCIAEYRKGIDAAYVQIFTHLLEFLKDSFCDRFLIDCPTCTSDDKIYLGVVHIDNGKVYDICNFRKRKYVKTFRTYGYWLSTIPILPVMKEFLTEFCCKTFTNKI